MPTLSYSLTQTWDRPGTSDLEYWKYADLYDEDEYSNPSGMYGGGNVDTNQFDIYKKQNGAPPKKQMQKIDEMDDEDRYLEEILNRNYNGGTTAKAPPAVV